MDAYYGSLTQPWLCSLASSDRGVRSRGDFLGSAWARRPTQGRLGGLSPPGLLQSSPGVIKLLRAELVGMHFFQAVLGSCLSTHS